MTIQEAIQHLSADLKRFADSGKASAKSIAFKELVINSIVEAFNALEERLQSIEAPLRARIAALEESLEQRDRTIAILHGAPLVDMHWSGLEGRAQIAIAYEQQYLEREQGRSLGENEAARRRKFIRIMAMEFDMLYDAQAALMLAHGKELMAHAQLRKWCTMNGVDLEEWDRVPEQWKHQHLDEAVLIAEQRRVIDGVATPQGIRTGRQYRNPSVVAYNILSAVAHEHVFRDLLRRARIQDDPHREPMWAWPSALEPATEVS